MTPLNEILEKLGNVKQRGEGYDAACPAHEDTSRHLFVSEADDGRVLAHCKHGCTFREIMEALGLELKDAFPKPLRDGKKRRYSVRDHTGKVTAIHHREDRDDGAKRVWWTTPDGKGGLGGLKGENLPLWGAESVSATSPDQPIVLCEGEKAAFALTYRGIPAVGTVTGAATTPSVDSLRVLDGRTVILWPDNDSQGKGHMQRIGKILQNELSVKVKWFAWEEAPDKGDAADHPFIRRNMPEDMRDALYDAPDFVSVRDKVADGAVQLVHAVPELEKRLSLSRKTGGVTGLRTGVPKVDNAIHGLNPGELYLVAARPNDCKSTFVGQVALTVAEMQGRVLLQTPEMSEVGYLMRWACYKADVDFFQAMKGNITDGQQSQIMQAAKIISQLPLLVDDLGTQTIGRIRENVERHEPDLLVVDYLQYLTPDDTRASRVQQVGQLSRGLAQIKSDYNIPVLAAAQLNRGNEHEKRSPLLVDLRDSGEIEQDADIVMMNERPDKNKPDVAGTSEETIWMHCRKNRNGQLWSAPLHFVPGQVWLSDRRINYVGKVS